MARWEPGSRERIQDAALELFAADGYAQVTAAAVAERAGVHPRTFYRHFPDKREVLFGDELRLLDLVRDAIGADPAAPPHATIRAALTALAEYMQPRHERLARRAAIVSATPELQERELRKAAGWADALAQDLVDRGMDRAGADACTHAAFAVFHVAFRRWLATDGTPALADLVDEGLSALAAIQPAPPVEVEGAGDRRPPR